MNKLAAIEKKKERKRRSGSCVRKKGRRMPKVGERNKLGALKPFKKC